MTQEQLNGPATKDLPAESDIRFVLDGKFILNYTPYFIDDIAKEFERQRTCEHAYCLNCKHVQISGFDEVFICEECSWPLGEAIP